MIKQVIRIKTGHMPFLWVAPIAFLVGIVFLIVMINDTRKEGNKAVKLEKTKNGSGAVI